MKTASKEEKLKARQPPRKIFSKKKTTKKEGRFFTKLRPALPQLVHGFFFFITLLTLIN